MRRGGAIADLEACRDRVKTDPRDAASLARLHRAGELTAVWVPDVGQRWNPPLPENREKI
jgi:transposase